MVQDRSVLFWTSTLLLQKSSMDGNLNTISNLTRVGGRYFSFVSGLALDNSEKRVYYSLHFKSGMDVYRSNYDGNERQIILQTEWLTYYPIMIFGDYIITSVYTAANSYVVRQCEKEFLTNCRSICAYDEYVYITDVNVYAAHKIWNNISICDTSNCTHLCVLSSLEPFYTCFCHDNYYLLDDNKTCVENACSLYNGGCSMDCIKSKFGTDYWCNCTDGYILQSDNKTCIGGHGLALVLTIKGGWIQININSSHPVAIASWVNSSPNLMTTDKVRKRLYWSIEVNGINEIRSSWINGTGIEVIVRGIEDAITGLDMDWISRRLHWAAGDTIRIAHLNGSLISTILIDYKNEKYIFDLKVDSFSGYMYFLTQDLGFVFYILDFYVLHCIKIGANSEPCGVFKPTYLFTPNYVRLPYTFDYIENMFYAQFPVRAMTSDVVYRYSVHADNIQATSPTDFNKQLGTEIRFMILQDGHLYVARQLELLQKDIVSGEESLIYTYPDNIHVTNYMLSVNTEPSNDSDINCFEYAKCWSTKNNWICLEPSDVCDGVGRCYEDLDEYYCNICPSNCTILGLAFKCTPRKSLESNSKNLGDFRGWESHSFSKIMNLSGIFSNDCSFIINMNQLAKRKLTKFEVHSLYNMHRLRQVMLSDSFRFLDSVQDITLDGPPFLINSQAGDIGVFSNVKDFNLIMSDIRYLPFRLFMGLFSLVRLKLSNNMHLVVLEDGCFQGLDILDHLTITGSRLFSISKYVFSDVKNLTFLNLSANYITILDTGVFDQLQRLKILDVRRNDIKLTSELFLYTFNLELIYSSVFGLCCIKPEKVTDTKCIAPSDDISSCGNLIGNRVLAGFLWIFGILACLGNVSVLIYRGFIEKSIFKKPYFMFVYNLGLADLLMSLYMLVIGAHDNMYDGIYVWNEYTWKRSTLCKLSGMISMISSEASMMFVCLITVERYFCAKFAFGNIKLTLKMAFFLSSVVWLLAFCIAIFPFWFFEEFYSRSGVCIGIPLTRMQTQVEDFRIKIAEAEFGLEYASVVFLGFNFLISALIPVGQVAIYIEVKKSQERVRSTQKGRQIKLAKRLSAVVLTDCCCWLPTGILVIMALSGIPTPTDVYAWVIVFVLPVNSAINPFLYTLTNIDKAKVKRCFRRK